MVILGSPLFSLSGFSYYYYYYFKGKKKKKKGQKPNDFNVMRPLPDL